MNKGGRVSRYIRIFIGEGRQECSGALVYLFKARVEPLLDILLRFTLGFAFGFGAVGNR